MAASGVGSDGMIATARPRRGPRVLALAYLVFFALLIAGGVAIATLGDPRAGDPVVRLTIAEPRNVTLAPPQSGMPQTPATMPGKPTGQGEPILPAPIVPPTITQPVRVGAMLVADPALIESTDNGPLPKIADDGTTPMRAYAAPVADGGHPRIAIVISGLGISAKATAKALEVLPPQVTLAFAPYASDVQRWVADARRRGHEVLLEVPMEPFDFPDSDPGQYTLRAGVGEDANTQRLVWALTRFTGYTGVTNLLGGRLLSDADSLEPVLTYLARRGLLFFDNGAATHSVAPEIAARSGVAFAQATATIDSIQTAMEIDRELSELENQARAHGAASGSGFIYPVTIARVAQWAQGLSGRGFVLVPASAIVTAKK
jgi:polysaccharide deacetylase 2 family uncharacterized protein YibQ